MIKIVLFGVIPTYLVLEYSNWWWAGYLVLLCVYNISIVFIATSNAAINIVVAKITYFDLNPDDQMDVRGVASRMCIADGDTANEYKSEAHQYSYYAKSMSVLGIGPSVMLSRWDVIKDPSNVPHRRWIVGAIAILYSRYGVSTSMCCSESEET